MRKTLDYDVLKIINNKSEIFREELVLEYPLNVYLNGKKMATLLCTPEKFEELSVGYLRTEGMIRNLCDIKSIEVNREKGYVNIASTGELNPCQFQSKKSKLQNENCFSNVEFLDSVECDFVKSNFKICADKIHTFMERNLNYSETFKNTGGVHCVSLSDGERLLISSEDIARHNALDKVIGEAFLREMDFSNTAVILSGRVSLEMILKGAKLGIPIIISKSAPTSLSVKLAEKYGITLIGFVREKKMNIYTNGWRILEKGDGDEKES